MKKYITTRRAMVQSMPATEAIKKGFANDDHKGEDGYDVLYENGFRAWIPKEEFDKTFRCCETCIDRLAIEKDDIYEKIQRLDNLINSPYINLLDFIDRGLLNTQFHIMRAYHNILSIRFKKLSVAVTESNSCNCKISGQPNN